MWMNRTSSVISTPFSQQAKSNPFEAVKLRPKSSLGNGAGLHVEERGPARSGVLADARLHAGRRGNRSALLIGEQHSRALCRGPECWRVGSSGGHWRG